MTKPALQHWRVVSATRTAAGLRINTALSGYGWLVPTDSADKLPPVDMGKNAVYWLVTLRIVKGSITEVCDVQVASSADVDATITRLNRLAGMVGTVTYSIRYCDPFTGKSAVYDGRSHLLWSELQPHGFDIAMEAGVEHKVSLACEFNLATKRVTHIASPPLVIKGEHPVVSYAAALRNLRRTIEAAAKMYGRDPREIVLDAFAVGREVTRGT